MPYILWYVNDELSDKAFYLVTNLPVGVSNGAQIVRGHKALRVDQVIYEHKIQWTVLQVGINQFNVGQIKAVLDEFGFEEADSVEDYLVTLQQREQNRHDE